ncbi:hypothetical protein ACROYT_G037120 [Oculina patagonica]
MKLHTAFLYLSIFFAVGSAYRLSRFNRGKLANYWANKEDPESDFYRKFGTLDRNVFESPRVVILPRPYVNPNKNKYKKKRPTTRPYQGTSASESEKDDSP